MWELLGLDWSSVVDQIINLLYVLLIMKEQAICVWGQIPILKESVAN